METQEETQKITRDRKAVTTIITTSFIILTLIVTYLAYKAV